MIQFDSIAKRFPDGTVALDEVSFEVPRGQFCALLGSSGAGKTTLLKTVNGLDTPSRGRVLIDGRELTPRSRQRLRRRVAMIHQHFNLVPRLSVEGNVLSGAIASVPLWRILTACYPRKLRRRAAELVEEVGLEQRHFGRRASELSGGQQQRVGIARAFLMQPDVVLADEPVASLDPATSAGILEALRRTAEESGATVLCSLHQLELARSFADRIVGMRGGRVVFDGPASDLQAETIDDLYRQVA